MSISNASGDLDRKPARKSAGAGFITYLKQIKVGALLIAAIAGAISKSVIREQLVAEQVGWLADAGVLVAMAALAALPVYSRAYLRSQKALVIVLVFSLAIILGVRASLVEELSVRGATHRYLVGLSLTAVGKQMEQNCIQATNTNNLPSLPRNHLLICAGPDSIRALYGVSYLSVCIAYSAAYMLFLGIFVVLVGREMQPNSENIEHA